MGRNYSTEALKQLGYGSGQVLEGDAALFLLKALLQSGVTYLGGYPGAPTSSLFDAISDAYDPLLKDMGVYFEGSGNEAAAASLLQVSVDHPIRGSVNWKVVGTNVAADVLAHIASSGVTGGVVIFVGEDYGCDSTTIAEKTHAYALKSTMVLLDPPGDAERMAWLVEQGFALSEASGMPAFYLLRTRVGNLKGRLVCKDNVAPAISSLHRLDKLEVDRPRIPQPPYSLEQEREKFDVRIPRARQYILEHGLNEIKGNPDGRIGIITHGVFYNNAIRALHTLGLADLDGRTDLAFLHLNVIEPLVPEQIVDFVSRRDSVLVVEEGMPNFVETNIRAMLQELGVKAEVHGKDILPKAGEYTPEVLIQGLAQYMAQALPDDSARQRVLQAAAVANGYRLQGANIFKGPLVPRSPIFCTGCPERPVFSALKIAQREVGQIHYAGDIGCYSMGSFAPFYLTDSVTGMGTAIATTGAMQQVSDERMVSFMGDGTFWHSGLTTSFANAVYNNQSGVAVIFENGWTSMTGEQENPATGRNNMGQPTPKMDIEKTLRGMGVSFVKKVNPYHLRESLATFREALGSREPGLKVVISDGECQLQKGRRTRVERQEDLKKHRRVVDAKFGVDDDVCTGDHSCMRLNGCPSLTLKPNPNPLRDHEIATIANSCVGCGLCGEVAHAAVLCPSFYEVKVVHNAAWLERLLFGLNRWLIRAAAGVAI